MLPYLNNEQLRKLRAAMEFCLHGLEITQTDQQQEQEQTDATAAFIAAKRIEGCSEKTLTYYRNTIDAMTAAVGKPVQRITTDDIRQYLTTYQMQRKSSKVTIDNIRRILATFYSWLEDEDYIVKSPVRRIHKVKTAKVIKETYTDEALEQMRDNCDSLRDLAIIDLLASSGMRVGELVALNRDDINFNERECVVFGKGNKERLVCNIDKQELIVVARGVGGTGDVKLSPGACFLTNLSIAVIVDESVALKEYLYYYFQINNLRYLDSGSAQSQITITDLKNVVVPIPSLDQQRKVVEILSRYDEKIEVNNKINRKLQ